MYVSPWQHILIQVSMENKKIILEGIADTGFERIDKFNGRKTKSLASLYRKILINLGEDPCREGLDRYSRTRCQGHAVFYAWILYQA